MIVAAGLSPAWQQILVLERLLPGEVNRARQAHWCASGKVLNVGIALAHLGADALMISPLGPNAREPIVAEFARFGGRQIWIETASRTRVCTSVIDGTTGQTTELVEEAQNLSPPELARFEAACAEQLSAARVVVFSGSLPAGTPRDLYARLLANSQASAVLDIRGPELELALVHRPLVVKPNREELARMIGRPLDDDAALVAAMQELCQRGAQWTIVSDGRRPLWITSGAEVFRVQPPPIEAVNPIGSGDCLAAGLAWQIDQGATVLEALPIAIAAAAFNATELLPARLAAAEVLAISAQIHVES